MSPKETLGYRVKNLAWSAHLLEEGLYCAHTRVKFLEDYASLARVVSKLLCFVIYVIFSCVLLLMERINVHVS